MENQKITQELLEDQYALLEEHNRDLVARIRQLSTENRYQFKLINTLIEYSPMGIILFDAERRVLQTNKVAENIFNIDRANLIGKPCEHLFSCYELHGHCPLLEKDIQLDAEEVNCARNKSDVTVLRSSSLTKDNGDTLIIEAFLDITKSKKTQLQLEQATKARDEFFDKMTHELRTPLNGIFGFAEIMKMRLEDNEVDNFDDYLENILKSGSQLLKIVEGMLEVADMTSGRMKLHESEILIDDILTRIKYKLQDVCKNNNNVISIENNCKKNSIIGDLDRILKILENLVDNACRFTTDGLVSVKVFEENCSGKHCLLFQVSDSGIGIPEDKLQTIFHVAEQVDNSMSRNYEGIGIGLTIAQGLAKLMNGKITVESVIDKGSTFKLTIPVKLPEQ